MPCRTFEITSIGGIRVLDSQTRRVVAARPAVSTVVVELLPLGEGVVACENHYRYPPGKSNVYLLDAELREVWLAELPSVQDVYVGFVRPGSFHHSSLPTIGQVMIGRFSDRRPRHEAMQGRVIVSRYAPA